MTTTPTNRRSCRAAFAFLTATAALLPAASHAAAPADNFAAYWDAQDEAALRAGRAARPWWTDDQPAA